MTLPTDNPIPAPNMRDWQHLHLARYLATDGEDGYWWQSPRAGVPGPVPTLILTAASSWPRGAAHRRIRPGTSISPRRPRSACR